MRQCTKTGRIFTRGYVFNDGVAYFMSQTHVLQHLGIASSKGMEISLQEMYEQGVYMYTEYESISDINDDLIITNLFQVVDYLTCLSELNAENITMDVFNTLEAYRKQCMRVCIEANIDFFALEITCKSEYT